MTLQNIANIATIVGVVLTILAWLVTRERFSKFWSRRLKPILIIAVLAVGVTFLWRMGWLAWLQYPVTWPVWGLILYPFAVFAVLIGIFLLYVYIDSLRRPTEKPKTAPWSDYYTLYGARWYTFSTGEFRRPPVCAVCLMEMRNLSMPTVYNSFEVWECRQCHHKIEWDARERGDLLEDVTAHFLAGLRRELEQQQ